MAIRDVRERMERQLSPCPSSTRPEWEQQRPAADAHKVTVSEATFTMLGFFLNPFTFSMPFLFAQSGLVSLLVLLLAFILCSFTGRLLVNCLQVLKDAGVPRPGYGDVATMVSGPRFGLFMQLLAPLECFVYALGTCIIMCKSLAVAFPSLGAESLVSASCALAVIQCAIPDKAYAYFSLLSTLSLIGSLLVVFAYSTSLPEWSEKMELVVHAGLLPNSFSLAVFCIGAHCCFPMLFNAVGSKEACMQALQLGMLLWLAVAAVSGLAGYYIFGPAAQAIIIDNVGLDVQLRPYPAQVAVKALLQLFMLLHCQLKLVPVSRPIAELWNQVLGWTVDVGQGGVMSMLSGLPVFLLIGPAAYGLMDLIAVVDSLCGSTLMSLNAIIFPSFAFVVICRPSGAMLWLSLSAGFLGIVLAVFVPWQYLAHYTPSV
ncbi:unnamed protein product [Polarella glacialis]|uniref:Amino acid transporter transmembrane domain-containing protein n=1 Tax=Polarella glacialis TaxID=89957 RepID=A0A813E358_POLGL|nr:unnamed protein product [Polarella glacialis]